MNRSMKMTWPDSEDADRWVAGTPVATGWPTPALVGDSGPRDLVSPATLQAQVDPLRLDSLDVGEREMARFLPLDGEARQVTSRSRMLYCQQKNRSGIMIGMATVVDIDSSNRRTDKHYNQDESEASRSISQPS